MTLILTLILLRMTTALLSECLEVTNHRMLRVTLMYQRILIHDG